MLLINRGKDMNISIKTRQAYSEVDEFLNPTPSLEGTIFAEKVTVNDVTLSSGMDNWDISQAANNIVTGTHTTSSVFYMDPLYFNETGNTMLLQTTITNVSDPIKKQPMAGLYVTDGTNKGFFGLCGDAVVSGQWAHNWSKEKIGYAVLSQWGNKSVKLEVVLKDGTFMIYADEVYLTSLSVSARSNPNSSDNEYIHRISSESISLSAYNRLLNSIITLLFTGGVLFLNLSTASCIVSPPD
jgi:hypothetical protein